MVKIQSELLDKQVNVQNESFKIKIPGPQKMCNESKVCNFDRLLVTDSTSNKGRYCSQKMSGSG